VLSLAAALILYSCNIVEIHLMNITNLSVVIFVVERVMVFNQQILPS